MLNFRKFNQFGFFISYFLRIFGSIKWALTIKADVFGYVYSASEFWMDSFPAAILKVRNPKIKWIASWYQTAPKPWLGFSYTDQKRYRFKAFVYWFVQLPAKVLINKLADFVLVNNVDEIKVFPKLNQQKKIIIVLGALDTKSISNFKLRNSSFKKYDAVFQGRFHPQKGVEELVDIWEWVVQTKPKARLVMIGDGPLKSQVEQMIKKKKLDKNIFLTGYLFDGKKKYHYLNQSKIVVHPSLFDSGGMAAAEAMAFGIPAVGFNLPSFKTYYPEGMIKVGVGDAKAFAQEVIKLLENTAKRNKIGNQAKRMIFKNYSWDLRAGRIFEKIFQ